MPSSSVAGVTGAGGAGAARDLRIKLVWLTVFRTVATTLLLAAIAARLLSEPPRELAREDTLSFAVIGGVYALTLIWGLVLRREQVGAGVAYLQVLGDVVLASFLVYMTGGADSPFTFTYSLAVVAGSILLLQRGALIAAAASATAFAVVSALVQLSVLHPPLGAGRLDPGKLAFLLSSNVLAQFLIAVLASYLARQLSVAGGQLSAREADLRQLAGLQRQILSCMPSGLITCTAEGRVAYANRAARTILGLDEAAGPVHLQQLFSRELELAPTSRQIELPVRTPHGERVVGLTVTRLEGDAGALLVVFQDLTDLRRIERALRQADRLAALGTLAAQLAHEIRNPLAAMRGSAQMLAQEPQPEAVSRRLAEILVREADRLSALVEEFLKFARPPPPALRVIALDELIRETVEMLEADPMARGVKVELELAPVSAQADPDQLRQVLLNLLRNALEVVEGGGRVRVRLDREGERPRIRVWDSAGAISPVDLARVFDPFFTTRKGGTGLGLSTAHSIIRAHGGTIEVSSSPAEGTEFLIELPAGAEVASANPGR